MIKNILQIFEIIIAILLIAVILIQQRGTGLGGVFGGEGNVYVARRGIEKSLFIITIIFAVLFAGIGFWLVLI